MFIKKVIKLLPIAFVFPLISGCLSLTVYDTPKSLSNAAEVYSKNFTTINKSNLPEGSYKSSSFKAPYEDVFRAVNISAGQSLFNIESSNKDAGSILATKSAKVPNPFNAPVHQGVESVRKYFYSILVTEKGPSTTDVRIVAKVQTTCQYNNIGGKELCLKESTVNYSTEKWHSSESDMSNFLIFIRNNLYAAGVL